MQVPLRKLGHLKFLLENQGHREAKSTKKSAKVRISAKIHLSAKKLTLLSLTVTALILLKIDL